MNKKIGFLVGRFQTPFLIDSQIKILQDFLNQDYNFYGIILGVSATKATKNNPLDFDSRRRMIEEAFPKKFQFGYIKDEHDDFIWSNHLDDTIFKMLGTYIDKYAFSIDFVTIFGDKSTVLSKYFGKFNTQELNIDKIDSIEFQKEFVSKKVLDTAAWRAGACWSASNRYPVAYHTVDCAIFDDLSNDLSCNKVWMAKKTGESKLRFVGGFVDPKDNSSEDAAKRESLEETGMQCSILGYISSRKINDWRYQNEEDKIITSFYALVRQNGIPKANDDIKELYKVDILTLTEEHVMEEHRELLTDLQNWVRTRQVFKDHVLPEV